MPLFIGLDVGTQGTKAILYDDQNKAVVARASVSYGLLSNDVPGRAEQHPETWFAACQETVRCILEKTEDRSDIRGIGVSGQQHGLVALDEKGEVIRPAKLWCDVESNKEAAELSEKLGHVMVPSITLTKILWMKNNEPENYARMRHVLLPHDYINYRLTGRMCMECGDASGVGGLDIVKKCFDREVLDLVDPSLVDKIPPLVNSNAVIGTLTPAAAEALGLPTDVIVSPGSGDNMMSALGAGAVTDGTVVLSLGTSACLFGCSSKPILDKTGVVCEFCDATDQWMPLVCTISCTGVVEEVKRGFGFSHDELTALAEKEPIGCQGVSFLPYLTGERTPNWPHARGVLYGLSPGTLRPGLIYRAALEGATFTVLNGSKRMKALGMTIKELRLVGGGSKNPLWRRIIADAFQVPLRFPLEPESAALGAALQAGAVTSGRPVASYVQAQGVPIAPGILMPNEDVAAEYRDATARHVRIGTRLFEETPAALAN